MNKPIRICSFDGCERKHYGKGLCSGHYKQAYRGEGLRPLSGRTNTIGMTDAERFDHYVNKGPGCWEWTASKDVDGYGKFGLNLKIAKAHRVSYEWAKGPIPDGMFLDHRCHNRACVKPSHLRVASNKENQENRSGARKNSKAGIRGASWDKRSGRWVAQVGHNRKIIHLGMFDTAVEAGRAAEDARMDLYTHSDGR